MNTFKLLATLIVLTVLVDCKGIGLRCRKMDISKLCSKAQKETCRSHLPDIDVICLTHNEHKSVSKVTLLQTKMIPYFDASVPVILEAPSNVTVPPGGQFTLKCLAEGAPTPDVQISRAEDADLSLLEETNSLEVELGMINVVLQQPGVIVSDEGWYRCVARNSKGAVYEDSYVTVKDLCADVKCPGNQVCSADYGTNTVHCTCPYFCTDDSEYEIICASNCGTYFGECMLQEENCLMGTNYQIYKQFYCPQFSLPEFVEVPDDHQISAKRGEIVSLTCRARSAGPEPGPPPVIKWYAQVDESYNQIGEGEVLELEVSGNMAVSCVAHHCSNSELAEDVSGHTVEIVLQEATSSLAHEGTSCHLFGDPYINTFDNARYKHSGVCSYVLSMDCETAQWYVYGRFSTCGLGTCLESVTLYYGREILELQRGWIINRMGTKLRITLGEEITISGDIKVNFDGQYIVLAFGPDNNELRWDGFNSAQIVVTNPLRTCGLCGNNNLNHKDEFESRWNGAVNDKNDFISSWQLNFRDFDCFIKDEYINLSTESEKEANDKCVSVFDNKFASRCIDKVDKTNYLSSCVKSVLSNKYPDYRAECSALQNYLLSCETKGGPAAGSDWRDVTSCSLLEQQTFTISKGCPQENPPV